MFLSFLFQGAYITSVGCLMIIRFFYIMIIQIIYTRFWFGNQGTWIMDVYVRTWLLKCYFVWVHSFQIANFVDVYGSRYSKIDQVKFVEDSLQKNWSDMVCLGRSSLGRPYHFKFFKGCLPQILFGPSLNTFSQIFITIRKNFQTKKWIQSFSSSYSFWN